MPFYPGSGGYALGQTKIDLHQFIVFIRLLGAPVRLSLKLHFADRPIDLFELLCFLIPLF